MRHFLTCIFLLSGITGSSQILPSAQRQKILDKEEANRTRVMTPVVTVFMPEKISCSKPVFPAGRINLINEYKDSIVVTVFWKGLPKRIFTLRTGKVVSLPINHNCSSLIIFNSKKYYCTNDLLPNKNYCVIWDPPSNCYCLTEYK